MKKYFTMGFFAIGFLSSIAKADIQIGLDDIENALTEGQSLRSLLAEQLGEDFNGINLNVTQNDIEFSQSFAEVSTGDCNASAKLKNIVATFDLDKSSSAQLRDANIDEDITVNLNIAGTLKVVGDLSGKAGLFCNTLARDSARLDFRWDVSGYIEAKVKFVQLFTNGVLELTPKVDLTNHTRVSLTRSDLNSSNTFSVLELLEGWAMLFTSALMPQVNAQISTEIELAEDRINAGMETFTVDLGSASELSVSQLASLDRGISNIFSTSLPIEYIAAHRQELLSVLLSDDINDASDLAGLGLFQEGVACELIYNGLTVPLKNDGSAINSGAFYETRFSEFCSQYADPNLLGNGKTVTSNHSQKWTLNPALNIDWSTSSIVGNSQPFMQRNVYKNVAKGSSNCSLEMRVYKKDIAANGLKPLIMFHGGGWSKRGIPFLSMESQISHYTDAGFVVFAPFYRLIGNEDGPSECNQATGEQITEDAAAAFEYVASHRYRYGAGNGNIALLGQSAGAHLAAWLAVNENYRNQIDKVIGYYGIYDFKHVAENVKPYNAALSSADYPDINADSFGTKAMSGFLGMTPTEIEKNASSPAILENTFTDIIARNPGLYPDFFLIHGLGDSLIPPIQSARLCDALGGTTNPNWSQPGSIFSSNITGSQCYSPNSFLFLISDTNHGLDICPRGVTCDGTHLNPGTREQSIRQAALAQKKSIAWLQGKAVSITSVDTLKPDLTVVPWADSDFDFLSAKITRSVFNRVSCELRVESDGLPIRHYAKTLPSNRVGGQIDELPIDHVLLDGRYNVVYDCGSSQAHSDFTIEMTDESCPSGTYRKIIDTHAVNFENLVGRKSDSGCVYTTANTTGWINRSITNTTIVRDRRSDVLSPRKTLEVKSNVVTSKKTARRTGQSSTYHSGRKRSCYLDYSVKTETFDPLTGERLTNTSTSKKYRYKYLTWKWYQSKKYCPSTFRNIELNKVSW